MTVRILFQWLVRRAFVVDNRRELNGIPHWG
jgi:hypothetical protein